MAERIRPASRWQWLRKHVPTRETVAHFRLLRPFAKQLSQPNLWRLNHRSVPRGIALGLGIGILVPFMHMVLAAVLAIPSRANIAIASACTLLVNPLTMGPIYYAAYRIGMWELRYDQVVFQPGSAEHVSGELGHVLFWLHHASAPIALGILTLAGGVALTAYLVSSLLWRRWTASRWRQRRLLRAAAAR